MKFPDPIGKPWWLNIYNYHGPWEFNGDFVKARNGYNTNPYVPGYNNSTDYLLFHRDFIRWLDDERFTTVRTPGIYVKPADGFEKPRGAYYQFIVTPDKEVGNGEIVAAGGYQETGGVKVVSSSNGQFPVGSKWAAFVKNLRWLKDDMYVATYYFMGSNYYALQSVPRDGRFFHEDALLFRYG